MKTKGIAIVFALFLGGFGIHHFYLGRTTAGVLSILFFWTLIPGFVALINIIQYCFMSDEAFNAKFNA